MAEVLNISTKRVRRTVKVDEVIFEMLDRDEVDMATGIMVAQLAEVGKKPEVTMAEARALSGRMREFASTVLLPAPNQDGAKAQTVLKRLTDEQNLAVLLSFWKVPVTASQGPSLYQPASV
jgi:hypothetical protein